MFYMVNNHQKKKLSVEVPWDAILELKYEQNTSTVILPKSKWNTCIKGALRMEYNSLLIIIVTMKVICKKI